jgi:uncharacterized protein DUF559
MGGMYTNPTIGPVCGTKGKVRATERSIAGLAERQLGVVARRQLIDAGIGKNAITRRVGQKRLHPLLPGVYAVGHRVLTIKARWMAAVLAAGPSAVLSHRAAGALHRIHSSERMEVTVRQPRRPIHGLCIHHTNFLPDDEVTTVSGIPVTNSPRTLLDLATVLSKHQLERAVHEAEYRQILDPLSLPDLVARYPGRRGIKAIKAALARLEFGANVPRKELEKRFFAFVDQARLPRPETNTYLYAGGRWHECDCLWRRHRLVVELDGRAAHATTAAFEGDRERDRVLQAEGWRVIRITWRQLHDHPGSIAADLRRLLG